MSEEPIRVKRMKFADFCADAAEDMALPVPQENARCLIFVFLDILATKFDREEWDEIILPSEKYERKKVVFREGWLDNKSIKSVMRLCEDVLHRDDV